MIKASYGELRFSEMTAKEVEIRFNALDGSNTRPMAMFKEGEGVEKYAEHAVYFERVRSVEMEESSAEVQ